MPQLPPQLPIWGRRALARIAQNTLWLLSAVAALLFVTQILVAIAKGSVATQIKRWEEKNNALANKVQQLAITYPQWAATNSFNNSINSAASPFRPADPALGKHLSSFSLKGTPFPDRQHFAVAASSTEDCMKQCTDGCWGVTYYPVKRLCQRFSSVDGIYRADPNDNTETVVWNQPKPPPSDAPATQWDEAPGVAFQMVRGDGMPAQTRSAALCRGACDASPACTAFTWSQLGGFCMMFPSLQGRDRRPAPGSISASKVQP